MKKAFKKIAFMLFSALMLCCFFAGCSLLSTKIKVTYMTGNTQYTVQEYDLNQQIDLPEDPNVEGQKFIGWYTDAACTQPYAEGKITAGLTLYAKFEPSVVYIIINTDGGEKIPMKAVEPGAEYELPEAVKTGYTFTGYYYIDSQGEKQDFPTSGVLGTTSDIVVFASYVINKYTITLHDGFSVNTVTTTVEYNNLYVPNDAVRLGYKFNAWHTVETNQTEDTVYDATAPVTADVDLYANYTANQYKITVANNADKETETLDVTYDQVYTLTAADKAGWTFINYTLNGEEFNETDKYTYAQNIRVTANYSKNAYSVTFKNAATNEVIATKNVEHGNTTSAPTSDLAKTGYTYVLYKEDKTTVEDFSGAITANTVVYVAYTANPYKITITNNVDTTTQVVDVVYDGSYTLSAKDITGYKFTGFTFEGAEFDAEVSFTYTHNITVRANYTKNTYAVTFKNEKGETLATQTVEHGAKATEPTKDLTKTGYTYTLSVDLNNAIVAETDVVVTYTAKTAVVTVIGAQDGYTLPPIVFGETFTLTAPTKAGYNFEGFTGSNGKTYEADKEYTCDFETLTLQAQFDSDEKDITFMANNATHFSATVLNGETVGRPADDPAKEGYTFKGWSTQDGTWMAYDFAQPVTSDITLYAYFAANTYTIAIDLDGGTGIATSMIVTYDAAYDLADLGTPTKKGYIFNGYEGKASGTYSVAENSKVTALWLENYKTVTFYVEEDEVHGDPVVVLCNHTVAQPANNPTKVGYEFKGWYTSEAYTTAYNFATEVTENISLYAKFAANTYTITIDLDGGTGIATSMIVTYDAAYDLADLGTPTKKGYIFNGYEGKASGTYSVAENSKVTALWLEDYKTVDFSVDGVETPVEVLNGFTVTKPADPVKVGYTFTGWTLNGASYDFSKEVTADITLVATFKANSYTITIVNDGVTTTVPVVFGENYNLTIPEKSGYDFVRFVLDGAKFEANAKYEYAKDVTITVEWKKQLTGSTTYFPEGDTFVYLVGYKYTFNSKSLTIRSYISGDESCVSISEGNNAVMETYAPCEIEVEVKTYDIHGTVVDTYIRTIKVVETVANFVAGDDYRVTWVSRNTENFNNNEKNDLMVVGNNNFIPDVKVQKLVDDKLVKLTLAEANVGVTVLANGVATTAFTVVGDAINFDESLVGQTLSVTLKPKYSPLAEGQQVTFNFVLNSGINVYDNASFKEAYENSPAGSVVNVLRNIKMELSADRMIVADGTEITKTWGTTTYTFTTPKGTVAPKQNGDGAAVYDRASGNLTINGNYFTADGTQIPLVDNRLDDWQFGTAESGYILPNVQFSLFKFGVDDKTKAIDDVVKMENLYILGNMGENVNYGQNDGETYKITIGGNTYNMLTMGGAAIGVQARYANVVLDNVTIRRCVLGMNVYSTYARETVNTAAQMHGVENSHHGSTVYVKDGLLEQCWANNVYMWGQCIITLDSTTVGVCSGAGIHVDSLPAKGVNSKLIFKNGTTVTNLLEGEETWFKAYNMAPLAKSLKSKVGDGVAYATKEMAKVGLADRQYSVLTKEEGSTKEKMNIAILIKSGGSATGTMWQQNDDEGYPLVEIEGLLYMDLTKLSEYGLPVTTGFEFAKFDTSDIEGMGGGNLIAGYVGLF